MFVYIILIIVIVIRLLNIYIEYIYYKNACK